MTVFHAALIHEPNDVSVMSRPDLCAAANDNSPPPRLPPSPRLRRTRRGTGRPDGACAYDAADNLISLTYPSGRSVTYARDALGRVVNVSTRSNAAAAAVPVASTISYAPFGPLTGLTFGNGVVLSRSYDADYRLRTHAAAGVQQMAYAYDADGNIASIIDTPVTSAKPAGDQSFAYDDTGRLIAANSTVYGAYSYSYDLSGNRTASSANGVNESYTIALSSNRLLSVSSPLAGASRSFSYDAAGNAANDTAGAGFFASNFGYSYDAAGDLAQVTRNGATGARYTADARHLRVIRDLPGASIPRTHFIYAPDGALLAEHNGVSGAALNEMIWLPANDAGESLPLAWQVTGGATPGLYMVHADHLGRPQKLTDAARALAWDARFAPFGEEVVIYGNLQQNLRFPGQYSDGALFYNWHRYYDPRLGRYLQSDPIGLAGGINSYGYAGGNPLRYTDPEGLNPAAGATLGGMAAGPPGAIVGGAIGLGLSLGAVAILNEILDGTDSPADKAKNSTGRTKEQCDKDEECYEKCKHLLPSPSGDLQSSEYRKCYRECKGSL